VPSSRNLVNLEVYFDAIDTLIHCPFLVFIGGQKGEANSVIRTLLTHPAAPDPDEDLAWNNDFVALYGLTKMLQ
jgi:hypothetical protein